MAGIAIANLTWTAPSDTDIAGYRIWQGASSTFAAATLIGQSQTTNFTASALANNTTYYFWAGSVDTSGNAAATQDGPVSITTNYVQTGDIATGAVTNSSNASNSGLSLGKNYPTNTDGTYTASAASLTVTVASGATLYLTLLIASISITTASGGTASVRLFRDGVDMGVPTFNGATIQDAPGAGSHTYAITLEGHINPTSGSSFNISVLANSIACLQLLR